MSAVALFGCLRALTPGAAQAQSAPCSVSVPLKTGTVSTIYTVRVAQSFTAPCNGQVSTVVLQTRSNGGADDFRGSGYTLRVRIQNETGSTVLATSGATDQFYPGSTTTFDLTAANLVLTSGTTYRWELSSDRAVAESFPILTLENSTSSVYSGGQIFRDGVANAAQDAHGWTVNLVVALPVELVAFGAQALGSSAQLSWETAAETNNTGFVVEHKRGGSWAEASPLVPGHGTTTERHRYQYTVEGLTAGPHTFRLRQIDTDGTVHFSDETSVEVMLDVAGRVTMLGQRAVRVETSTAQPIVVALHDVLGRVVWTRAAAVDGTVVVDLPSVPAGAYVVRVAGERFAQTRTLVVR